MAVEPRGARAGTVARLATLLAATLVLAGCSGPAQSSRPSPATSSEAPAASAIPDFDHIVVILEENKPSSAVLGSADAPFLDSLTKDYASAGNYNAITHPSLPNYLALTSGTTAGITDDCSPDPDSCSADVGSIADSIEDAGRTWRSYGEDMPEPCYQHNSGDYAVRHVPFVYYPSVREDPTRCDDHVVPFSAFADDLSAELPDFSFVTPNLCNDMHNCSVASGDDWLAEEVPRILTAPAFEEQNSLLVITFDEGDRSDNRIPFIAVGSSVRPGFTSEVRYDHYSLLRTIEAAWDLPPLTENDAAASPMTDLFG